MSMYCEWCSRARNYNISTRDLNRPSTQAARRTLYTVLLLGAPNATIHKPMAMQPVFDIVLPMEWLLNAWFHLITQRLRRGCGCDGSSEAGVSKRRCRRQRRRKSGDTLCLLLALSDTSLPVSHQRFPAFACTIVRRGFAVPFDRQVFRSFRRKRGKRGVDPASHDATVEDGRLGVGSTQFSRPEAIERRR